jgi:hypothetical protein
VKAASQKTLPFCLQTFISMQEIALVDFAPLGFGLSYRDPNV